jgi:hypothetical protein
MGNSAGGSHDCSGLTGSGLATCLDLNGRRVPPALINGGAGVAGYDSYGGSGSVPGTNNGYGTNADPGAGNGMNPAPAVSGSTGVTGTTGATSANSTTGATGANSTTGGTGGTVGTRPSIWTFPGEPAPPPGGKLTPGGQVISPMDNGLHSGTAPNLVPPPNDRVVPLGTSPAGTSSSAAPQGMTGGGGGGVPAGR